MRVMHIISGLNLGGAERMLMRIVSSRVEEDWPRATVVSLTDEGACGAILLDAGVDLICLNMSRTVPSPSDLFRLIRIIRSRKPDLIMTWLYHADLLGTLAALLAGLSTRQIIWNLRCSSVDFSHFSKTTLYIVRFLSLLSRIPGVVATNSHAGRFAHMALGYRPKRWAYLPNGFDLDEWRPNAADRSAVRAELGLADDAFTIGMVARIDPQKDHATFLAAAEEAANARSNLRFVLIGLETESLPLPASLVDRVIALGVRHDVPRLMRAMDIHVLCSTYGEGFPNVVGEAMASEVPCIVTDVGDAAALIENTGLVVPSRDPTALAEAMLHLADETPEQHRERGHAARAIVEQRYDIGKVRGIYSELWQSTVRFER